MTARLFLLLLGFVTTIAHAQQIERPQFRPGDTWQWITRDAYTKLESSRSQRVVVNVGEQIDLAESPGGAVVATWTADGVETLNTLRGASRVEKLPVRPWPITVGKTWQIDTDWVNSRGGKGRTQQTAEAVSQEEVVVPAGKFLAIRIELKGTWNNYTTGNSGRQYETWWYAPSAAVIIRSVFDDGRSKDVTELVTFSRQ